MEELWLDNGELIEKEKWISLINNLKTNDIIVNKGESIKVIKDLLTAAVKKRTPSEKLGILFSGGVDSSSIAAICKEQGVNFTCYTVGFQDEETKEPDDISQAKIVAEKVGFDLKYKIYNLAEAREIIAKTVKILKEVGKTDVVNVGVGAVVLATIELAQEDHINYFLGGLGSEEIFAGYERHEKAADKHQECWEGLQGMWERDLVRDFALAQELGVVLRTPFLDEVLIDVVMKLPIEWKISEVEKKIILREAMEEDLGIFAWRPKKAAQYGSCFDKAISKLARREGFKLKKEWVDHLK